MKKRIFSVLVLFLILSVQLVYAQSDTPRYANDIENILPERQRAIIQNEILEWRLDNLLPEMMNRFGIDIWITICREYNEDPVYLSMVPEPTMAARRTSILIIHRTGPNTAERYTGSFYGMGKWYKAIEQKEGLSQVENAAEFIKSKNPETIGINVSETFAFGDGLTANFRDQLVAALGKDMSKRIVSAEELCLAWLGERSPRELSIYRHLCGIAHEIIAEFFSNEVIVPDITTGDDVKWWIRQRITELGLETWFQPSLDIYRSPKDTEKFPLDDGVIRRGDMLHCDIGIVYLGLCTDTQELAYVCRIGEKDAPEGLKKALANGNRVQDIFMNEFKTGRTGNDILLASLEKAKAEGLVPSIYTHPLGVHGHAAGTTIGLWDQQGGVPGKGDYPLYPNTCYAIELNCKTPVPEWDGMIVTTGLEEGGVYTEKDGAKFINGRQEEFFLIW